ncbi:hypothetical protein LJR219_004998 [Phenylobacterium sp. LjRoot219]|uniref:hypothetical protein n=1 Tax=Phenylobacterium sp. LjRoot219 TaxID=3342283 RepID=UPI003ECC9B6E
MTIHTEALGAEVVARAAAAAIVQVQDEVVDLFGSRGRSGVIARLRIQAKELSASGIAFEQIKSLALDRAADDVSWGRPPLANWSTFVDEESRPSTAQRLALRLQVGPPDPEDDEAARELSRTVIARVLADEEDAFSAARRFPQLIHREGVLQETLWDDPRLAASPSARRLMRAVAADLQRKLSLSPAAAPRLQQPLAPPPQNVWRRLLGRVQAYAGLR